MTPVLFDDTTTDFNTRGLGALTETTYANVKEVANGSFELELDYPTFGTRANLIEQSMIIVAKPNDQDNPHAFRIYEVDKDAILKSLHIVAASITSDENGNNLDNFPPQLASGTSTMARIKTSLDVPSRFTYYSDIADQKLTTDWTNKNPTDALLGTTDSFVATYGGELKRENDKISMLQRRGRNSAATIRYRKNLSGLTVTSSMVGVVTRILPIAKLPKQDGQEDAVQVSGTPVDSPLFKKYPIPLIRVVDFTDDKNILTVEDLNNKAKTWFSENEGVDEPTLTIKLDILSLQDSADYTAQFKRFETIGLFDTVNVYYVPLGINLSAKVSQLDYNPITETNQTITLGTADTSYSYSVANTIKDKLNQVDYTINQIWASADGKNSVSQGGAEPHNPKTGDLWYKPDGEFIEMLQWDGGAWVSIVNTGDLHAVADQVAEQSKGLDAIKTAASAAGSQAVVAGQQASVAGADAKSAGDFAASTASQSTIETAAARSTANSAVDQANLAVSQAGFANDAAYQAKTAAANAQADAANALSGTSLAQQDATKALASAQAALTSVTAANDTANRADSSASAAQASAQAAIKSAQTAVSMASGADAKAEAAAKVATTADSNATDALSGANIALDSAATALNQARSAGSAATSTATIAKSNQSAISTLATKASVNTLTSQVASTATLQKQTADELLSKADSSVVDSLTSTANSTSTLATQTATALKSKAEISTVNTVNSTATSAATLATQTATTLKSKADSTTVDKLTGRVSSAESKLTQTATKAELALTQSDIDDLGDTVSSQGVKLAATATAAELAATQDNVDTLKKTVTNNTAGVTANAKQIALKANQTDVDTLKGTVTSQGAQVAVTASQVALKADTATVNNLGKTVASQGAQLSLTATEVDLEAAQSAVDAVTKTATSNAAGIATNANAIKLKADSSTVSTLDGRVTSLSGQLDVQADKIAATVTASDVTGMLGNYATQSWSQGQISAAKNEISASVETVQTQVNNSAVGTNLLTGTSSELKSGTVPAGKKDSGQEATNGFQYAVNAGETYTYQVYLGKENQVDAYALIGAYDENKNWYAIIGQGNTVLANTGGVSEVTFTIPDEVRYINLTPIGFSAQSTDITVYWKEEKLEKGSVATDWSPAPEDMASQDWTKSLLDVSEGKVTAQVQSVKTDLTNTLNNNIKNATAGMATTTWTNSQITAAEQAISLDVEQSITTSENTLNSNIDNATNDMATKTWTKGQLSITDGSISASVQKLHDKVTGEINTATNGMATQTWTQGKLNLTADGLTSQISSVQNGLDTKYTSIEETLSGVQVTANNAVTQSQYTQLAGQFTTTIANVGAPNLVSMNDWYNVKKVSHTYYKGSQPLYELANANTAEITGRSLRFTLKSNTKYMLSFFGFASSNVSSADVWVLGREKGETKDFTQAIQVFTAIKLPIGGGKYNFSAVFTTGNIDEAYVCFDNNGTTNGTSGSIYFTEVQIEEGTVATPYRISDNQLSSQITQLQNDINLRVKTGDLVSQIDVNAKRILLDGASTYITNKTYIDIGVIKSANIQDAAITTAKIGSLAVNTAQIADAAIDSAKIAELAVGTAQIADGAITNAKIGNASITTAKIGDAQISSAKIISISADKITAGTLDAAKVNVVNLNASNITTGTISGANLSINLNTGEVTFQKGRIHSSNDTTDVNIDQGYISTANYNTRVLLKGGEMQFVEPQIFDNQDKPYLKISNSTGAGASLAGAAITGREYMVINTQDHSGGIFSAPLGEEAFVGLSMGYGVGDWQPTKLAGGDRGVFISGGHETQYSPVNNSPYISVGASNATGSKFCGNRVVIDGEFVHILPAYSKTTSSSPNLFVANDGALVRSTSASKYKTDIKRTKEENYGQKLLELPTATWLDKATLKRYEDDPDTQAEPVRNFGMIAEDLAEAGLEMLVARGADGELEGINYDRIGPALIPVIAKLQKRIKELENSKQLKGEI